MAKYSIGDNGDVYHTVEVEKSVGKKTVTVEEFYRLNFEGVWEPLTNARSVDQYAEIVFETEDRAEAMFESLKIAFQDLMQFRVQYAPEELFNSKNDMYDKGDEKAPLVSEAFLYVLLGKEDARSVLSRMRKIQRLLSKPLWGISATKGKLDAKS